MIWIDAECSKIFWGVPKESPKSHKGFILTSKITAVKDGLVKARKIKNKEKAQNTFTIVSKGRTLELEASTYEAKLLWMGYFQSLFNSLEINLKH